MLTALELAAVVTSAIFGILLAREKSFDIVGIFSVAFLLAFGGGTLRDLFLDRHPLFWIENSHYPVIVFLLAIVGSLLPAAFSRLRPFLHLPDALGLALFTITGAAYALQSGTSFFIAALMGTVTGTFGGVLGEVVCNDVPSLFRSAPLYATCSFTGAWLYLLGTLTSLPIDAVALAAAVLIVVFRLLAVKFDLRLPASPELND
jgi:uncharacterized membrane protein YeiH